jgi:hypothetical protein
MGGWKIPCYTGTFVRGYLSKLWRRHGSRSTPDRILAIGAAPYHHQIGTLATSARTGTTAEAPGPILTGRLSLALPKGAGVARTYQTH